MGQMGFFDVENRYAALDAKTDPLVTINALWSCSVSVDGLWLGCHAAS